MLTCRMMLIERGRGMKEDQRVRLSRQLLRSALIVLLKEKNINKISVREICDAAEQPAGGAVIKNLPGFEKLHGTDIKDY